MESGTFIDQVQEIASSINRIFLKPTEGGFHGPFVDTLREVIEEATLEHLGVEKNRWARTSIGMRFDFRPSSEFAINIGEPERLLKNIRSGASDYNALLFGSAEPSLLQKLADIAARSEAVLDDQLNC